ncbi:MAG: carbohydrate-binding domain-containing protein [Paludibacteraceae bacterium]
MKTKFLSIFVLLAACLSACSNDDQPVNTNGDLPAGNDLPVTALDIADTIRIVYDNTTVRIENDHPNVAITADGTAVTINSTAKNIKYIVSGTSTAGSLKIYSDSKFVLELSDVHLTSTNSPAINIQTGKCTYLQLVGSNTLCDAATYLGTADEDAKATLFSEGQLIVSGDGSLAISSVAHHAICSDDYIVIDGGTIAITSAGVDGIHANDYVRINGGNLTIVSSSDGIESGAQFFEQNGGTVHIQCGNSSGCQGINSDSAVVINGGALTVAQSYEAIEAVYITIHGGNVLLTATDDAINATKGTVSGGTEQNDGSSINIDGGVVVANVTSGDAIDSNGTFSLTGGVLIANGPKQSGANEAVDVNGTRTFTGGTLLTAQGSSGNGGRGGGNRPGGGQSGSTFAGNINTLSISASVAADTWLGIEIDGNMVMVYKATNAYQSFLFGSDAINTGSAYAVYTGGNYVGGYNVGSYYYGGSYSGGTLRKSGTIAQQQTSVSF